jgi:lysophospholipase L1-like esterase
MLALIPLFYQLIEAYHPESYTPPAISIVESTPTPANNVLGISITTPSATPSNIGGEGHVITIAVLGDSMIATLGPDISSLKLSLKQYFPTNIFNLINFGQSATTIDKAASQLPEILTQKPDIIVVESFAYNNFGNTQSGFDKQWQYLSDITSKIKSALPNTKIIIAATIAPNSVNIANGIKDLHLSSLDKIEKANTIKLYLQNAINFANSVGFPLADAYHLSLVDNDGNREFISSTDNLHPSASGATLFSDVLADTISRHKLLD